MTAGGSSAAASAVPVLIAAEGIVGPWVPPTGVGPLPTFGVTANLALWPASIRAQVLDAELRSALSVITDPQAETATVRFAGQDLFTLARPAPAVFLAQLEWIRAYADLRSERLGEIVAQTGDILTFFAPVLPLKPEKHRHTLEFIGAAMRAIIASHMQVKHAMACPRPAELSVQVQPVIPAPGHGSFPSGHATEAHAAATLLAFFAAFAANPPHGGDVTATRRMLFAAAGRIAVNRTVAGVHYPVDSEAGARLGHRLALAMIAHATGTTRPAPATFAVSGTGGDFLPDVTGPDLIADLPAFQPTPDVSTPLGWLLARALGEWA